MAFSSSDVTALERAIATGAREVRFKDRTVKYHSMAEMREALAMIRREVNAESRKNVHLAKFKRD